MDKGTEKELLSLGTWSIESLNYTLRKASRIKDTGRRIGFISEGFIGTAYRQSTLFGDAKRPEVFIVNLKEVDCFTFIDYIEAMRLSGSFSEFKDNLRRIRYKYGKVAFKNRNHFFSDWAGFNKEFVDDVTEKVGGRKIVKSQKVLNVKSDGTYLLRGVQPKKQVIKYIPSGSIDSEVISRLKTGDYKGVCENFVNYISYLYVLCGEIG